jgi:hypothetical protein
MPRWSNVDRRQLDDELAQIREDRERLEADLAEKIAAKVDAVAEAARAYGGAGQALEDAVAAARAYGASWTDIGAAVGLTRQAAYQRWGADRG